MKSEVTEAIEELKKQFSGALFDTRDDNKGGAYVIMESVRLGSRYEPNTTWIGFHIPAQYPYADIYPVFIDAEIKRKDGVNFKAPITHGHKFESRDAIQISRRNGRAGNEPQKASSKILKILDYLENLQ